MYVRVVHILYVCMYVRVYVCRLVPRSYLLDEVNAGLKVQAEVDELPLDALSLVLLLFEDEHVVVEELLQFLVGEVDAKLLKGVVLDGARGGKGHC